MMEQVVKNIFIGHNTAYDGVVDNVLYDAGGDCNHDNIVGSFTIDPGNLGGISLKRFWVKNIGTAEEGTHIPNDAFKIFYEPSNGSGTFDKDESLFMVYGDYNSNSTFNNEYGNDNISASIDGKTRFYVTMCKLNMPAAKTKTVQLVILNDGISFSPLLYTNYGLFRIGETDISRKSITIPLTLLDFKADLEKPKNQVHFTWKTVNEVNNSYFSILKSVDGLSWDNLGKVESIASNRDEYYYDFIDKNPMVGLNYYRLEQFDLDGKMQVLGTLVVNNDIKDFVSVFPNPSSDKLYIVSNYQEVGVEIYNLLGKIVLKENIANHKSVNVSYLRTGLYKLVVKDTKTRILKVKSIIIK